MSGALAERMAIVSDIHANLAALEAVLEDIAGLGISVVLNLGDTVGYGPDPEACIDLAGAECRANLCGNHDYAVLNAAEGFNPVAKGAIDYHRFLLAPGPDAGEDRLRRWAWLQDRETVHTESGFEAMHASPRNPIAEYILPSDPELDPYKIHDIFQAMIRPVVFVGHTHFPGIVEDGRKTFIHPSMLAGGMYRLGEGAVIVNVGSVGQPRDRDPRSCYVIFDGETVTYRRVAYDIEVTIEKVNATEGALHPICGLRLRDGR